MTFFIAKRFIGLCIRICVVATALVLVSSRSSVTPAQAQPMQRPIVFIPGILGSVLELKARPGTYVWGNLWDGFWHFSELAWPVDQGVQDDARFNAPKLLDNFQILGPWTETGYAGIQNFLRRQFGAAYSEFPYDWRYSNLTTACKLAAWIRSKPELAQRAESDGIIIVAHSMGGLVGNLFAHFYDPSAAGPSANNPCPHKFKAVLIVTIGTPYRGSLSALKSYTDGPAAYLRALEWDDNELRRVFYSIPSVYELAPSFDGCCLANTGSPLDQTIADPLAASTWTSLKWLPRVMETPVRRAFVLESLSRAAQVREILNQPMPATKVIRIAGVGTPTTLGVVSTTVRGSSVTHKYDEGDGDGTVPAASAEARGIGGQAAFSRSAKANHMELLDSSDVKRLLLLAIANADKPLPDLDGVVRAAQATETTPVVTKSGQVSNVLSMGVEVVAQYLPTSQPYAVTFSVVALQCEGGASTFSKAECRNSGGLPKETPLDTIDPGAVEIDLRDARGTKLAGSTTALGNGSYSVHFTTPASPGALILRISLPAPTGADKLTRTAGFAILNPAGAQ